MEDQEGLSWLGVSSFNECFVFFINQVSVKHLILKAVSGETMKVETDVTSALQELIDS